MLNPDAHDFIYYRWVVAAHERGFRFDFHLPASEVAKPEILQAALVDFIKDAVANSPAPPAITLKLVDESSKYRAMSAMQKAIRRNNPDMAWEVAGAMLKHGFEDTMWRRLGVISFEDVGLADPYLMAMVCMALKNKPLRTGELGLKVAHFLVTNMAKAPKCRDLCSVVVYAIDARANHDDYEVVKDRTEEELFSTLMDDEATAGVKLAAHWRCYGKWEMSRTQKMAPAVAGLAERYYAASDMPPLIAFLSKAGKSVVGEALGYPVPMVYGLMCESETMGTETDPMENWDDTKIGRVYAATFDKHTWDGKACYGQFRSAFAPLKKFFKEHPHIHSKEAHEMAMFYVEGGILRPRLKFDRSLELYWDTLDGLMFMDGIRTREEGVALYKVVQSGLNVLNDLRRSRMMAS